MATPDPELVESIFHAACDEDPERWPALVRERTDSVEVQEEVLSLLRAHALEDPLFGGGAQETWILSRLSANGLLHLAPDRDSGSAHTDPPEPDQLGPYVLVSEIGRGGIGVVYLARDPRLEREVAIKALPWGSESSLRLIEHLRREARLFARLTHPNIVTVHDVGEHRGVPYLVLEYVEGESLRERLQREPLSVEATVQIAIGIASGLAHAHGHGITHGDIKPENILLRSDGSPKIADFGLGRFAHQSERGDDLVVGTPSTMSPERVRGGAVSPASDLWSLGAVIYECLTEEKAFPGQTAAEIMEGVLQSEPVPPSRLRAGTPSRLESLVLRCLEKEPQERVPSADTALAELQNIAARRSNWRRWMLVGGGAAIFMTALVFFDRDRTPVLESSGDPAPILAVVPRGSEHTSTFQQALATELAARLSTVPGLRVISPAAVHATAEFADTERWERLGLDHVVDVRLTETADSLSMSLALLDPTGKAEWKLEDTLGLDEIPGHYARVVKEIAEQLRVRSRDGRSHSTDPECYRHTVIGAHLWKQRTPDSVLRAVEEFRAAIDCDPEYAPAHAGASIAYLLLANYGLDKYGAPRPTVGASAQRAIEIDPEAADAHLAVAMLSWLYERDWNAARVRFETVVELDPSNVTGHHWFAMYLASVGETARARREIELAESLDPVSPIVGAARALLEYCDGDAEQALGTTRRILELNPGFVPALNVRAKTLLSQNRYEEALAANRACIDRIGRRARYVTLEAIILTRAGDRAGAAAIRDSLETSVSESIVSPWYRAILEAALGDRAAALLLLEEALQKPSFTVFELYADPIHAELRQDEHLVELCRRLGLPDPH